MSVDTHLEFIGLALEWGQVECALALVIPHLKICRRTSSASWIHEQIDNTVQNVVFRVGLEPMFGISHQRVECWPFEMVEVLDDPERLIARGRANRPNASAPEAVF